MAREKTHINLVFIGHVDHGKSTTVGRLMFDSGNIDEQTMRKLKEKAEELGKGGFEFAFVTSFIPFKSTIHLFLSTINQKNQNPYSSSSLNA